MNRRAFLSGLIAAPAVIRVAPLMRIAPVPVYGVGPIMLVVEELPGIQPCTVLSLLALQKLRRKIDDNFFIPPELLRPGTAPR